MLFPRFVLSSLIGILVIFAALCCSVRAQQVKPKEPKKHVHYVPMKMDRVHRGFYNFSTCANDMYNCWEFTRPERWCMQLELSWYERRWSWWSRLNSAYFYFGSMCHLLYEYCNYQHGYSQYNTAFKFYDFDVYENVCPNTFHDRNVAAKLDEPGRVPGADYHYDVV